MILKALFCGAGSLILLFWVSILGMMGYLN